MIIGATLSATPYKIRTSQAEHFLRCGADILLNGLSRNIDGEGKCVICGTTTRLKMSEGRLQELDPETALLHVVEIPKEPGKIGIECEVTHLFDTEKCLLTWQSTYAGKPGMVFRPREYLDHITRGGEARVAFRAS